MINHLLVILFTIHAVNSLEGGIRAEPQEFTYLVSIQRAGRHQCSGVIVTQTFIMTSADRIIGSSAAQLSVLAGNNAHAKRFKVYHPVEEMYLHPGFTRRSLMESPYETYIKDHDIAVLKLKDSLIWSSSIAPVPITDVQHSWGCYFECLLISWAIPQDRRQSMFRKWEFIELMSNQMQQQWSNYLGMFQKFFDDPYGVAVIGPEDVGSPLVCAGSLVGLVVEGEQPIISGKPSIMVPIAPYLEFIDDIIYDGFFEAEAEEFPYAVAIWYNGTYACGGFIVDTTHVATAGHCVATLEVRALAVSMGYPPLWFLISNVVIHPNYTGETTNVPPNWNIDYDVAILTLKQPIVFNQKISSILFAQSDAFYVGQLCNVLRWKLHKDRITGTESITLMSSRVIILDHGGAQSQLDPNFQSQMSSFMGQARDRIPIADQKDVGNPIICDGNPVGFLIQAIPFNGKTTAILTRYLKIRPYIDMGNNAWFQGSVLERLLLQPQTYNIVKS